MTTIPVIVDGVAYQYSAEYTTSDVKAAFAKAIDALFAVAESASAAIPPTNASLVSFNNALNQLKKLALGVDPGTGLPLSTSITSAMAKAVNSIITLTHGINPNITLLNTTGFDDVQQLTTWTDLYYTGLRDSLVAFAGVGDVSTRSLQSYIQLEYISRGNKLLYDEMSQLNVAMNATNSALIVLGKVQNLMNKAVMVAPANYTSRNWANTVFPGGTIGVYSAPGAYKNTTNSLDQPLLIGLNPQFASGIQSQGTALIAEMNQLIFTLNQVNPPGATDPTSLQSQLQNIINNMTAGPSGQNIAAWALDNSDNVQNLANKGLNQRSLHNAISVAESLNTSQNTALQTQLFNFQEFYASASSLLRTMNRLITQMASKTS